MGDVAMTVPVLLALHRDYPNLKITVVTKPHFAPIFNALPFATVIKADVKKEYKGLFGIYRLFLNLKKLNFFAVADLHNVLRSKVLGLFFKCIGVKVITIDKGRKEKKNLINGSFKQLPNLKTTHQRYAEVFKKLGYPITLKNTDVLPIQKLSDFKEIPSNKVLIGIAPFASFESKMYPLHLIKEVISGLIQNSSYQILLFGGGKKEKTLLDELANSFSDAVFNLTGKYSFQDELALISNLNLMISMDSGNGHLAANYGVPVVSVWGVTHPCLGFAPFWSACYQ